jgi:hypothetical protein
MPARAAALRNAMLAYMNHKSGPAECLSGILGTIFDHRKRAEPQFVAIAHDDRDGEVRYLGEIGNSPNAVRKLVPKLSACMSVCIFATISSSGAIVARMGWLGR